MNNPGQDRLREIEAQVAWIERRIWTLMTRRWTVEAGPREAAELLGRLQVERRALAELEEAAG